MGFLLRHLPTAAGGMELQVSWIPVPVWAVSAMFLCCEEKIQLCIAMQYRWSTQGCTSGTTAAGGRSDRKDPSITFCLKNSEEPLQISITSCGITKIGILHLSYALHPVFSSHICNCCFSLKQKGGKTRALGKNWLKHLSFSTPSLEKTSEL